MRQRVAYILKHYPIMQKLYRIIMSFVFQVWGTVVKTDEDLVLFVSFMGKRFNDSPKVMYDYMQQDGAYSKYRCVWAFENPADYPFLNTVKIDSPEYFRTALKAKYWVTNTNIERGLRFKKKNQIYLNTWHGVALKHIGNDCPGRKDYNFDTVNYLVVSGTHDENVWKSAFNADPRTYLRCGMPRNEELWHVNTEKQKAIRNKLNLSENVTVILYAPTWRDSIDGGKTYEIKPPIHFEQWREILGKEYVVLFRAHHQTTKVIGVKFDDFVIDVSDYPDVNDLMIASDILITDYSAIAFDYCILCKPLFCYAYDYESYLSDRGTYFDIDECYPNKSCRTEEELLSRIKNIDYDKECENTKKFRDRFVQYGDEATTICVNSLLGKPRE